MKTNQFTNHKTTDNKLKNPWVSVFVLICVIYSFCSVGSTEPTLWRRSTDMKKGKMQLEIVTCFFFIFIVTNCFMYGFWKTNIFYFELKPPKTSNFVSHFNSKFSRWQHFLLLTEAFFIVLQFWAVKPKTMKVYQIPNDYIDE